MDWDIGVITHTSIDADGFIGIQVDGYGGKDSGIPDSESHSPFGFHSHPIGPELFKNGDPDPQKSGQALYAHDGKNIHVWPLENPALVKKLPRLKPGGSVVYAATGSFHLFQGETGNQTLYVPFAIDPVTGVPAKAHVFEMSADRNEISIVHASGLSLGMKNGTCTIASPDGSVCISVSNDGILLNGNVKIVGSLDAGGGASLPLLTSAMTPCAFVKGS